MSSAIEWEALTLDDVLRDGSARGYRQLKNGRFEAFCSDHGSYMYLGTCDTPEEAEASGCAYRYGRLVARLNEYNLYAEDGVLVMGKYLAFSNGMIFNLRGERMRGGVNRDGYVQCILNGRITQVHRVIASIFCVRELGKDFVNHIDGDKQNNDASNLEWVTRSENALHSFRTGLQSNIGGVPVYSCEEKQYMREHCFEHYRDVASTLGRNPETVRKYLAKYRKESRYD